MQSYDLFCFLDYDTYSANLPLAAKYPQLPTKTHQHLTHFTHKPPLAALAKFMHHYHLHRYVLGQANIQQNFAHYTKEHEQLSCFHSTLLPCFASHCRLLISIGSLIHLSPVYQYSAQPILTNEHAVLFVHIYFLFNDKHSHTRMCV